MKISLYCRQPIANPAYLDGFSQDQRSLTEEIIENPLYAEDIPSQVRLPSLHQSVGA